MNLLSLLLASLFLFFPFVSHNLSASPYKPVNLQTKATWIWHTKTIKGTNGQQMINFMEKNNVTDAFLNVDEKESASAYASFISSCSKRGIRVTALSGDPSWALTANQNEVAHIVDWVSTYNANVPSISQFSGIQMDIEPWTLPEWRTNQSDIIKQWMRVSDFFVSYTHQKLHGGKASATVAFWLNTLNATGTNKTLSQYMVSTYDYEAIMSYRNTASATEEAAYPEVNDAAKVGKKVLVSFDTTPSTEGPTISFHDKGLFALNSAVSQVIADMHMNKGFGGVAIHDYANWSSLK